MAPKKTELEAQIRDLTARHQELVGALKALSTHTAVLGVALRQPDAVPAADLEAAIAGINGLAANLAP